MRVVHWWTEGHERTVRLGENKKNKADKQAMASFFSLLY
jgi:hypothetical protein